MVNFSSPSWWKKVGANGLQPVLDLDVEFNNTNLNTVSKSISGAVNENKASIDALMGIGAYTNKTDPVTDNISVSDIDDFIGVVITLTAAGNNQTLPTPTVTSTFHTFTVINDDASTDNINIIGSSTKTLQPGEKVNFVWDGDAWIANEATGIWLDDGVTIKAQDSSKNLDMQSGSVSGVIGNFRGANSLTLGTASSADGGVIYQNSTNANTVKIQSGITSTSYTLTLPLAVGGAGEFLNDVAGDGILSWSAATAWNDNRTNGIGIGLVHTIGASAALGVQSMKTTINNTQTNALIAHEIELGSSALGHIGQKINCGGVSTAQIGSKITKNIGLGYQVVDNSSSTSGVGFYYLSNISSQGGTAFKDLTVEIDSHLHQSFISDVQATNIGDGNGRTLPVNDFESRRTVGTVTTVSDDFDLFRLYRSDIKTSGTGTFNATGSVLKLVEAAGYVAGTFNNSVKVLELVQSSRSTGAVISIDQKAIVNTDFRFIEFEINTGISRWYSNGTDPNGNLTGTAGDLLINGLNNQLYSCISSTNWVNLGPFVDVTAKSANTIAALIDIAHVIEFTNGVSDYSYSLPQNSDVAFPIGSWMEIRKTGSGEITIAKGTGATFRGSLGDVNVKINGTEGVSVFVEKTATNTWLISGSVKAV